MMGRTRSSLFICWYAFTNASRSPLVASRVHEGFCSAGRIDQKLAAVKPLLTFNPPITIDLRETDGQNLVTHGSGRSASSGKSWRPSSRL